MAKNIILIHCDGDSQSAKYPRSSARKNSKTNLPAGMSTPAAAENIRQIAATDAAVENIDAGEIAHARSVVKNSKDFDGNFVGWRSDFRSIFENICRRYPAAECQVCQRVSRFYEDCDRLQALREKLETPGLSDQEFLRIYKENGFLELVVSLSKRKSLDSGDEPHVVEFYLNPRGERHRKKDEITLNQK